MAKERIFNLPETKGTFQLRGKVTGVDKDNFYTEKKTKTGRDFRMVNFGATVEDGKTLYISLNGMPRDKVYFSKPSGKKGVKGETVEVPWAQRHTFNREGFRLIGINVGVTKTVDSKGNYVNDKKTVTEFDACDLIGKNLKDDESVFIRGDLEFSSYSDNDGNLRHSVKLTPKQVSLCQDINFDDEKFNPMHDFTQTIVFMGIEQEVENEKPTGRFVVSAKIITYSTIEDAEFIITDNKLANVLRKNVKPYNALTVWGKMDATTQTETVESDDVWGESNAMTKVSAPTKREYIITGADPNSVDATIYTKDLIDEALVKIKNVKNATQDFGESDNDGWGTANTLDSGSDDDDMPW